MTAFIYLLVINYIRTLCYILLSLGHGHVRVFAPFIAIDQANDLRLCEVMSALIRIGSRAAAGMRSTFE